MLELIYQFVREETQNHLSLALIKSVAFLVCTKVTLKESIVLDVNHKQDTLQGL